jgi:V/A-type H+-transporting ATPase subunit I
VIVPMVKVRLLGPSPRLTEVLRVVQDVGILHLTPPPIRPRLEAHAPDRAEARRKPQIERAAADCEAAYAGLALGGRGETVPSASVPQLARWARLARRARTAVEALAARRTALEEEQALLSRYRELFTALESLLTARALVPGATAYHVVLRRDQAGSVPLLRTALHEMLAGAFELLTKTLASGETAVLLLVPKSDAPKVDRLLAETRVQEMPVPHGYGDSIEIAIPRMRERAAAIPGERDAVAKELGRIARRDGPELRRARAAFRDELARLAALPLSGATPRAFVLEGWVPETGEPRLRNALAAAFGAEVSIERVSQEQWRGEDVPVVLANPRLFRPFETITRTLPLPKYGSLDPTPYVAVFFPMFFGLMLGDAGYGFAAALLALVLHRRSRPDSRLRTISEMLGACALFAIAFGIAFGELFGTLGRRWFGLRPLLFDRETALIPFLALAVALGVIHVVLGLVLGAISQRRAHPRAALGRGLSAIMVLLIVVALLAAVRILPAGLLTPAAIALLIAFPVLVLLEGVVGPVEFLSNLGHILSYARIMALGTASVMLAVVANRLAGSMGSVLVGALFGLLFHLVNFGLGLFSPAIHALRLHYVEFFGTFYSPGGTQYQPLGHWTPDAGKPA